MSPVERARVIPFFKEIHLFAGMDDAQLSKAARFFEEQTVPAGTVIFKEKKPGDAFYFLMEGEVLVTRRVNEEERQVEVLHPGDFFGEEALLRNRLRFATVKAIGQVTLLRSSKDRFKRFIDEFPQIELLLEQLIDSRQFLRRHPFSWLNDGERVHQIRRKHGAFLLLKLIIPSLILFFGTLTVLLALESAMNDSVRLGVLVVGSIFLLVGALWGLWNYVDWLNDYYIVTDQRVVWIEVIVFLYQSLVEAPLESLRGINVKTTLVSRILGYGNVDISTYTSQFTLTAVGNPKQMEALIREFWRRAQQRTVSVRRAETEREVDKLIHPEKYATPPPVETAPAKPANGKKPARALAPGEVQALSPSETYLGGLFRQRTEANGVITYRKHWLVLLRKAWRPLLLTIVSFLLIVLAIGGVLSAFLSGLLFWVLVVLLLILLLVGVGWLVYNYLDWSNDIYQITKDTIYDIEKKPLGDETRTSAPLDRVISLNHERRGFIGYLFNYGNVNVNVGDQKLTFNGVFQPARVQQDVFRRMQEVQDNKKKQEVNRERDRILELLEIYHQRINDSSERSE
jgi:uncharacterized membrane protein YdbT with pleckstrin-like domain